MTFGVLRFPGSCDEVDALLACERVADARIIWHGDTDLGGVDAVVVPGGFSYGDYLRVGSIARFAPAMERVIEFAAGGRPGARHLQRLPGALRGGAAPRRPAPERGAAVPLPPGRRRGRRRRHGLVRAPARAGDVLSIPVKHTTGRWFAPPEMLDAVEANGQVVFRYAPGENPNGSLNDVAGVRNERGNVVGLMPHPEHAVDPLTGSTDGLKLFESAARALAAA